MPVDCLCPVICCSPRPGMGGRHPRANPQGATAALDQRRDRHMTATWATAPSTSCYDLTMSVDSCGASFVGSMASPVFVAAITNTCLSCSDLLVPGHMSCKD
jgi:hypothetical protein